MWRSFLHHRGRTLAVVADATGLRLVRHEPEPPAHDAGWVAPLPRVGPFIEWAQSAVPHLVVLADRAGADIVVFTRRADGIGSGGAPVVSVGEDSGDDPVLRKSNPGGWSQRRYQHRAENQWENNAREVADQVAALADETGRASSSWPVTYGRSNCCREHLPERTAELLREVDGSRAPGSGLDEIADDVVKLAATVVAEDTVEFLRQFKQERGQGDLAVEGMKQRSRALAAARVDTLLIHDDPDDDRTAWFGPEPGMVAQTRKELTESRRARPQKARLVDVAIRAAFTTGAAVRIVPSVGSVKAASAPSCASNLPFRWNSSFSAGRRSPVGTSSSTPWLRGTRSRPSTGAAPTPISFPSSRPLHGDRTTGDYAALEGAGPFDAVVDMCAYVPRAVREAVSALGPSGLAGPTS